MSEGDKEVNKHQKAYYHKNKESILKKVSKYYKNKIANLSKEETKELYIKRKLYYKKYYLENKKKINDHRKKNQTKNYLRREYGLTELDYTNMLNSQGGLCAICRKEPSKNRWSKLDFFVDHNHVTNKVRGLLCSNCNLLIGHAFESIDILNNSILYLQKHGES